MKNQLIRFGLPGLLLAALIIGFANKNPQQKEREKVAVNVLQEYHFYPKQNIYFNASESVYFFQDQAGSWQQTNELPSSVLSSLTDKVSFTSARKPVWYDNEHHRLIYATTLYATSTDLEKPAPVQKIILPENDETVAEDTLKVEKKEKGFKKFWKNLFGKKKEQ